jgi:hypothetical protein
MSYIHEHIVHVIVCSKENLKIPNTRYIYVSCFHLYTKCFVTDIFDAHMSTRGVLKQIYLIMFMFTLGVFQWGSVTRSLVLCVCFVDRCLLRHGYNKL